MSGKQDGMDGLSTGRRLGPYELLERIGSGGMGVVFKARDTERNTLVALKTLHNMDPLALLRLKNEFRGVANVLHPNLVSLYELMRSEDVWFFTMEFVEGRSLATLLKQAQVSVQGASEPHLLTPESQASLETVTSAQPEVSTPHESASLDTYTVLPRPGGAESTDVSVSALRAEGIQRAVRTAGRPLMDPAAMRRIFTELALGICALHDAGKIHRDIKPANVLLAEDGRVVVLDFGLVAERTESTSPRERELAGTPAYMSPEQAMEQPATEASDWYAMGVMLYEALCGHRPFAATTALQDKQHRDAPPLPESPWIPEELRTLCMALLSRSPAARPSGREVLARLSLHEAGPATSNTPATGAHALFGRKPQLDALWDAYQTVKGKRAVLVHVHGGSGMGKTALIQHFFSELRRQEFALVLSGRCYERELVPYKAFDDLIDALSQYLWTLTPRDRQALLPPGSTELACAFPVLRRLPELEAASGAPAAGREQSEVRRQAFRALKELLTRLAARRPLVLHIDDLQWGDPDSFVLINELISPPEAPPLLLLCSFRTEEAASLLAEHRRLRDLLGAQLELREVEVEPLAEEDAARLAASLLGLEDASAPRAVTIAREAQGNPFFVEELSRYARAESTWAGTEPRGLSLERAILTRVGQLPDSTRNVLEVVAVAGRRIAQGVAARAAEAGNDLYTLWNVLRTNSLVRTGGTRDADPVECYHDRIRESVQASLEPERQRVHHQKLAHTLESSGSAAPEELARHYLGAGDREKAAEHLCLAADRAAQALAFEHAADLYGYAIECRPGDRELKLKRADALVNAGRGVEAAPLFLDAAQGVDAEESYKLRLRACEQFLLSSRLDEGTALLRPLLKEVGLTYPESLREAMVGALGRGLLLSVRGTRHRLHTGPVPAEQLKAIDLTQLAGNGLRNTDMARGFYFVLLSAQLALRAGEPRRVSVALSDVGVLLMMMSSGARRRGQRVFDTAWRIAEQLGDPLALATLQLKRGLCHVQHGELRASLKLMDEALRIFEGSCTGVAGEISIARALSLCARWYAGDLEQLSQLGPRWIRYTEERGDLYGASWMRLYYAPVLIAGGALDGAEELVRATRQQVTQHIEGVSGQYVLSLLLESELHLYRGHPERVVEVLDALWARRDAAFALNDPGVRIYGTTLRAMAALALASGNPADRKRLLAQAKGHTTRLSRERHPLSQGAAALARAGLAHLEGDRPRTLRELDSAIAGYEAAEMELRAHVARRRKGELLGGEEGQRLVNAADEAMRARGIRDVERWSRMYSAAFSGLSPASA